MAAKITNNLSQFIDRKERAAARGMTQALILGASEASVMTPIDTSTLLNSQFKAVEKRDRKIVGTVGYTAAYAAAVHDPEHPQNFRRPTAKKEFLRLGFERAEPSIRQALKGALK